jgi:hypothetical protein
MAAVATIGECVSVSRTVSVTLSTLAYTSSACLTYRPMPRPFGCAEAGARPSTQGITGEHPLHTARAAEVVRALLPHAPSFATIDKSDPLLLAYRYNSDARWKDAVLVQALIDAGKSRREP